MLEFKSIHGSNRGPWLLAVIRRSTAIFHRVPFVTLQAEQYCLVWALYVIFIVCSRLGISIFEFQFNWNLFHWVCVHDNHQMFRLQIVLCRLTHYCGMRCNISTKCGLHKWLIFAKNIFKCTFLRKKSFWLHFHHSPFSPTHRSLINLHTILKMQFSI